MRSIDGDALIEKAHHEEKGMSEPFNEQFGILVEWLVDKTPTIEPERKKGKWIRTDMTDIVDGKYINWMKWNCSECGVEKKIGWAKGVNFCPNCGADMREGD